MTKTKTISKVELVTTLALVYVLTDLRRAFHVQDEGLSLIVFYYLSQDLLTIAFAS